MKKTAHVLLVAAFLLLLTSVAAAGLGKSELRVPHVSLLDQDVVLLMVVGVENDYTAKIQDAKVTVTIPELGLRTASTRFDLHKNQRLTKQLLLELDGQPTEEVWVRVVVSADDGRRVIHRPLFIE